MREVRKDFFFPKTGRTEISEIKDGIYRISGFVDDYGITFNQFLINDEKPTLIHTGPVGMYEQVEQKVKEVIPIERLANVAFLHFESDEWGGMDFLKAPRAKLVCSDLSSKLNLQGWGGVPVDHLSFWENEVLKTGKRRLRFMMTPHVHHWDSMMVFEETTGSLFTSDLFIQPGRNDPVTSEDLSQGMLGLYRATGIFGSEEPVRQTTKRLLKVAPKMVFPMHGSSFDGSMLPRYADALFKEKFAFSGKLLGRDLEMNF